MKSKLMRRLLIGISILLSVFLISGIFSKLIWNNDWQILNTESSFNEDVFPDIIEGTSGSCYTSQNTSRSIDADNTCNEYSSSHGPGRERGGLNILSAGCRNYM